MTVVRRPKMLKHRITKWKIDKKKKRRDMKAIMRIAAQRNATGKADPQFRVRGKPVTVEQARSYFKKCRRDPTQSPDPMTPSDVSILSVDRADCVPKYPATPVSPVTPRSPTTPRSPATPFSRANTPVSRPETATAVDATTAVNQAPNMKLQRTLTSPQDLEAPERAFYSANQHLDSVFGSPIDAVTRRRFAVPVAAAELLTGAHIEYASAMDAAAFGRFADARIMLDAYMGKFVQSLRSGHPQILSRVSRMLCHTEAYETEAMTTWTLAVHKHVCHLCAVVLGPSHPITIIARTFLQSAARVQIQESLLQQTLAAMTETLGEGHASTFEVTTLICRNLLSQGKVPEAVLLMQRTAQSMIKANLPHSQVVLESQYQLGWHQRRAGHIDAAIGTMTEMMQRAANVRSMAGNDIRIRGGQIRGRMLRSQGRYDECGPMFRELLTESEELLGKQHEQTVDLATDVAQDMERTGHLVEARNLLARFPPGSVVPV